MLEIGCFLGERMKNRAFRGVDARACCYRKSGRSQLIHRMRRKRFTKISGAKLFPPNNFLALSQTAKVFHN